MHVIILSLNLSKTKMSNVEHKTFDYLGPGLFFQKKFFKRLMHTKTLELTAF